MESNVEGESAFPLLLESLGDDQVLWKKQQKLFIKILWLQYQYYEYSFKFMLLTGERAYEFV